MMRELIGAFVQFAIASAAGLQRPPRPHRACLRPALRTTHARTGRADSRPPCRSTRPTIDRRSASVSSGNSLIRLIRVRDDPFQQRHKVAHHPLDRRRIEQIGAVDHCRREALCLSATDAPPGQTAPAGCATVDAMSSRSR